MEPLNTTPVWQMYGLPQLQNMNIDPSFGMSQASGQDKSQAIAPGSGLQSLGDSLSQAGGIASKGGSGGLGSSLSSVGGALSSAGGTASGGILKLLASIIGV